MKIVKRATLKYAIHKSLDQIFSSNFSLYGKISIRRYDCIMVATVKQLGPSPWLWVFHTFGNISLFNFTSIVMVFLYLQELPPEELPFLGGMIKGSGTEKCTS